LAIPRSVADAAFSIVLFVVAIASDAAGDGVTVVDVVVEVVLPGVSLTVVVFFSHAASSAAAASIETRATGVRLVRIEFSLACRELAWRIVGSATRA